MAEKKIPMRQCLGCREMKPKKELLRVVRSNDGQMHIDRTGKANGRGAYVCPKAECLKKATKARLFPTEILDQLTAELEGDG